MKKTKTKTKKIIGRRRRKANTWTKPKGVSAVHVTCVGAGGSGGSGRNNPLAEAASPHLYFWRTRDNGIVRIDEMEQEHLLNARALLRRKIAKFSEIEEAMSREFRKRHNRILVSAAYSDPMGKYSEAWSDETP